MTPLDVDSTAACTYVPSFYSVWKMGTDFPKKEQQKTDSNLHLYFLLTVFVLKVNQNVMLMGTRGTTKGGNSARALRVVHSVWKVITRSVVAQGNGTSPPEESKTGGLHAKVTHWDSRETKQKECWNSPGKRGPGDGSCKRQFCLSTKGGRPGRWRDAGEAHERRETNKERMSA